MTANGTTLYDNFGYFGLLQQLAAGASIEMYINL